jgi:hypothetical protein
MNKIIGTTVYLSHEEHEVLSEAAHRSNLKLSTYMRRELIQSATLSRDAAIVTGEIGRLGELVKRGFEKAGVDMRDVCGAVNAIDARVFVAQLQGVNSGQ